MKKPHRAGEGAANGGGAGKENLPYLRAPFFRRPNPEREWLRYRHNRTCEGYLSALNRYRHHLENPSVHRA